MRLANHNQQRIRSARTKPASVLVWSGIRSGRTLLLYLLLALILGSGLSIVGVTHQHRFSFNELQQLRDSANQLDVQWGQLLLEQSTFGVEGKIEDKAVEQLQMRVPQADSIVVVSYD